MSERDTVSQAVSEVIVETLDNLWNHRKYDVIDDAMAEDCLHRTPTVADGEVQTGRDTFKKEFLEKMHTGFEGESLVPHPRPFLYSGGEERRLPRRHSAPIPRGLKPFPRPTTNTFGSLVNVFRLQ
jgi:hypothetical protein